MYLTKEKTKVNFVDFGNRGEISSFRVGRIELSDLNRLMKYMQECGRLKLGFDFFFIWGPDAPEGKQFMVSITQLSVLMYRNKSGDMIEQYVYKCIELMLEEVNRDDLLEVWE